MVRHAWVVVAAVLVAGCSGGEAPEEPVLFEEIRATATTGVIRGIVLDQALKPVQGATVGLRPGDLETKTDAEGAFGFRDLEPGTYFLTARKAFHTEVQVSADVVAGEARPRAVKILVEALPVPVPFVEALSYNGFMDSSIWVQGVGGVVVTTGLLGEGSFGTALNFTAGASWIQAELVWEAAQPLADSLLFSTALRDEEGGDVASTTVTGPSALVAAYGADGDPRDAAELGITVFAYADAYPVGFTFQQPIVMFVHNFHHFMPDPGWTFTQSGAPQVPKSPDG